MIKKILFKLKVFSFEILYFPYQCQKEASFLSVLSGMHVLFPMQFCVSSSPGALFSPKLILRRGS